MLGSLAKAFFLTLEMLEALLNVFGRVFSFFISFRLMGFIDSYGGFRFFDFLNRLFDRSE